uniref:Uncharacterized protein n=1 Tax=Arundo donax TaxID=35708 RepID=A0A0A9BU35_ARUDO
MKILVRNQQEASDSKDTHGFLTS